MHTKIGFTARTSYTLGYCNVGTILDIGKDLSDFQIESSSI